MAFVRGPTLLVLGLALVGAGVGVAFVLPGESAAGRGLWTALRLGFLLAGLASVALGGHALGGGRRPSWTSPRLPAALLGLALGACTLLALTGALSSLELQPMPEDALDPVLAHHLFPELRRLHPLLAATLGMLVGIAPFVTWSTSMVPAVRRWSIVVGLLFVAQLGVGFVNLSAEVPGTLRLVHGLLALALWTSLVSLTAQVLATPRAT